VSKPTFIDFFAGIGGFRAPLEAAGWKCVYSVELSPFCRKVHKERWGHEPEWANILKVKPGKLPHSDLWCGGPPCQDLSVAGKRAGLRGSRSGLFYKFVELVKARRPQNILLEQVPGLLSSHGGRDMEAWLGALAKLGYRGAYWCVDAQFRGVPQRRRRIITLLGLGDPRLPEVFPFAEGRCGHSEAVPEAWSIHSRELARGVGAVGGGNDYGAGKGTLVAATLGTNHKSDRGQRGENIIASTILSPDAGARTTEVDNLVPSSDKAHAVAKSSGGGLGGRDGQDDYVVLRLGQTRANPLVKGRVTDTIGTGTGHGGCADQAIAINQPGRNGGSALETSEKAYALRSSRGSKSRQHVAATITSGSHGNSRPPGRRRDEEDNLIVHQPLFIHTADAGAHQGPVKANGKADCLSKAQPGAVAFVKKGREHHDDGETWGDGEVAPTLNVHDYGGPSRATAVAVDPVPMTVRRLTPTECERLQGFPDGHTCLCGVRPDCPDRRIPPWLDPKTFRLGGCGHSACGCKCPDSPRYKALGNAVATPVIFWVGGRLRTFLSRGAKAWVNGASSGVGARQQPGV